MHWLAGFQAVPCTPLEPASHTHQVSLLWHCLQACLKSTYLRHKVAMEGYSPAYLWKRALDRDSTLMLKKESIRPAFSEKDKQIRYEFALKMLQQPPEFLQSIVFMDESSVPVLPAPQRHTTHGRSKESTTYWQSAMQLGWSSWRFSHSLKATMPPSSSM